MRNGERSIGNFPQAIMQRQSIMDHPGAWVTQWVHPGGRWMWPPARLQAKIEFNVNVHNVGVSCN